MAQTITLHKIFTIIIILSIGFIIGSLYTENRIEYAMANYDPVLGGKVLVSIADKNIQIYNGLNDPIVILQISDESNVVGQFIQFNVADNQGKLYNSAGQCIYTYFNEDYPKHYGIILSGDNAIARFESDIKGSVEMTYYVQDDGISKPELIKMIIESEN